MGAPTILASLTGGLLAGQTAFGMESEKQAEKSRIAALKERMRQVNDATRQHSIENMEKINHTLASQSAIAAAGGGSMMGPVSSNMISMADINQFAADENVNKLDNVFQQEALESDVSAVSKDTSAQEIETGVSGLTNISKLALNYYVPTPSPTNVPEI